MKNCIASFIFFLALGFLPAAPVIGTTPDLETPAEEGVCDSLKANTVTRGLYGLCVAFCEAQDFTTPDEPITEAELDALLAEIPSGAHSRQLQQEEKRIRSEHAVYRRQTGQTRIRVGDDDVERRRTQLLVTGTPPTTTRM